MMKLFSVLSLLFTAITLLAIAIIATTSSSARVSAAITTIPLGSADNFKWTFVNTNKSISGAATVPGDIFGDLRTAGFIGDINYRYISDNISWAAYENWTYATSFDFPSQFSTSYNTFPTQIVFESIRIVANIFVNDVWVGETHDQFIKYDFLLPVKALLPKGNKLTVAFNSTVLYARQKAFEYPIAPLPSAPAYKDEYPYRNFVRGEQSQFAWDWGVKSAQVSLISTPQLVLFTPSSSSQQQNSHVLSSLKSSPTTVMNIEYVTPHIFTLPFGQPTTQPLKDFNNSFLVDTYVYVSCWGQDCFRDGSSVTINIENLPSGSGSAKNTSSKWTFYDDNSPDGGLPVVPSCTNSLTPPSSPLNPNPTIFCKAYVRIRIEVRNVQLWWPREVQDDPSKPVGFQYPLTATLQSRKGIPLLQAPVSKKIGFRSIELITKGDPLDYGLPTPNPPKDVMFFRVNGIPVFSKGANVVPFDALPSKITQGVMEQILMSAERAHMNTLRLWGGNAYPKNSLVDFASSKGIMIWQEQIFACAEYPINPEFLSDVRKEIRHQLRRLGHQASIIVWSGNNENGIYDYGPNSAYEILNDDTVMEEIFRQDTSRPVWPSSPSTGWKEGVTQSGLPSGTMENPAPFQTGGDSGDTHWYNYFNCPNISVFPRTNFASEYGFQSLPFFDSIKEVSEPQDWNLFSTFMDWRQHHPNGNTQIAQLIQQNFGVDPSFWNKTGVAVFKQAIFLSQLQQTLCISQEAAFYRRGRDEPYRTSGSLYWQLNQNWPAPSWTSIEYGGEWKLLHYAMSNVYSKIFVSSFINETDGSAHAHVSSDMLNISECAAGLEVYLIPLNVNAAQISTYGLLPFLIDRRSHLIIQPLRGEKAWSTPNVQQDVVAANSKRCPTAAACFLYFRLNCSDVLYSNNPQTPTPLFLAPFAQMAAEFLLVTNFTLQFVTVNTAQKSIEFLLSTNAASLFTYMHAPAPYNNQGSFSINGVVVLPGLPLKVSWSCIDFDGNTCDVAKIDAKKFVQGIQVENLNNLPVA